MTLSRPSPERAATIYDVAASAGVSHQTVSRYLHGFEGISPGTRERVRRALDELGYRPNLAARTLATSRPSRVGVLTTDLISAGPSSTIQGIITAARASGYSVEIEVIDPTDDDQLDCARTLVTRPDLGAVIAIAVTNSVRTALARLPGSAPLVVDDGPADHVGPGGRSFNAAGIELCLRHLYSAGHRDILHVSGPQDWLASHNRAEAYRRFAGRMGLVAYPLRDGDWTARSGYDAVRQLPLPRDVTALLCANDQMALGAIRALAELGRAIPGDISVTGFDDIAEAAFFNPPLTTVRIDFSLQGSYLFQRALAHIEHRAEPAEVAFMKPVLVTRASTAPRSA